MADVNGLQVKELHCKNDDCRKLLGYEKINSGVLVFECPRCKFVSVFKIRYPKGREIFDKLADLEMNQDKKGGEN